MKENQDQSVNVYRLGKITLLQIMGSLAVLGLLATWVLSRYFSS
jgi:hypothetical protein